jgi:predicted RND superfamily exporter protein
MITSKRNSFLILIAFLLITGIQVAFVPGVKFNYDFDQFFPADHEETQFFEEFKQKYGSDNDFLIIGFAQNEGIFNKEFLGKIAEFTDFLENHNEIRYVNSPMNTERLIRDPCSGALFKKP